MKEEETESQEAAGREPAPTKPIWQALGLERSDAELLLWLVAGFIIGVALKVTVASAIIIAIVVIVAIGRLYYEASERNARPGLGMVPMFLLGWGLGLFVRAVIS